MQRDPVKPMFTRPRKPGAFLPSVIVLPKIENDRNDRNDNDDHAQSEQSSNHPTRSRSFIDGKRASTTVFQPLPPRPKSDKLAEQFAERTAAGLRTLPNKPPIPPKQQQNKTKQRTPLISPRVSTDEYSQIKPSPYPKIDYNGRLQFPNRTFQNPLYDEKGIFDRPVIQAPSGNFEAFEDQESRDMWHCNKAREIPLSRQESVCSSCGGPLSYTNSFASTRRFSAVSIEVPNEDLVRQSYINTNAPVASGGTLTNDETPPQTLKRNENRKMKEDKIVQSLPAVDMHEYDRMEKQRNLLYDLISVLYKKNFVREEIRPYVRHALELCNKDSPTKK